MFPKGIKDNAYYPQYSAITPFSVSPNLSNQLQVIESLVNILHIWQGMVMVVMFGFYIPSEAKVRRDFG